MSKKILLTSVEHCVELTVPEEVARVLFTSMARIGWRCMDTEIHGMKPTMKIIDEAEDANWDKLYPTTGNKS